MDWNEFYEFHGLSTYKFATMIGIGYTTLRDFERGCKVSKEARLRVEIGVEIMEDLGIIFVKCGDRYGTSYEDNSKQKEKFYKYFNRAIFLEL